jgi:hypothetical protein
MQQLLAMGAVSKLPEDVQWNVRVLLPRTEAPAIAAAKAAAQQGVPAPQLHAPALTGPVLPALGGAQGGALQQFAAQPPQQQQQQQQPLLAQVALNLAALV